MSSVNTYHQMMASVNRNLLCLKTFACFSVTLSIFINTKLALFNNKKIM
jgi:hypothetical protein